VKFIYFGISYDNPCSPLSLSLLPAPRSPFQAHVLATSVNYLSTYVPTTVCEEHDSCSLYLGAMIIKMDTFTRCGYGFET
jgi:hypothetical protein